MRDRAGNGSPRVLFTTSWDDGHPLDLQVADLLLRHGFQGTFYVPLSNSEGPPVLRREEMRRLDSQCEVASHTVDHCYLGTVPGQEARRQITVGKQQLEQILGRSVSGFSYPGGHYTRKHRQMVAEAGFAYARTGASFYGSLSSDPFAIGTTIQCYPHSRAACVKNYLSRGGWTRRRPLFAVCLWRGDLASRLQCTLDYICVRGGVFHLWGHSNELAGFDGSRQLESFLRYAAERVPIDARLTNHEVMLQSAEESRPRPQGRS
jgi:peptidoglycan/xylan/chitin deacetylase (PgdA/CDA1 family)